MTKQIDAMYQASVKEQQAGMNRTAALKILKSEDVAKMTMSQFIEEVKGSEVWAGAGGIGELLVSEFGGVGTKKKPQMTDRPLLDNRINEVLGAKRGEWMSGSEIAQAVKDVQGATPQAVAGRLRVLAGEENGQIQKSGEGASRRYASAVAMAPREGRAEKREGELTAGASTSVRENS